MPQWLSHYETKAFAPALPSSDNSDLWLFVSNGSSETFAEDTGYSISNILPRGRRKQRVGFGGGDAKHVN